MSLEDLSRLVGKRDTEAARILNEAIEKLLVMEGAERRHEERAPVLDLEAERQRLGARQAALGS